MTKQSRGWFGFPWPVWVLGGVSLLNDTATEAVYPLLPFFLTQVLGAGAVSLGVIEGIAEATNSVLKIVSGRLSDRRTHRKPIIIGGYGLSAAARPFIGLATTWPVVLVLRFIDRMGKGIRGAPRDAMLADLADPTTRGRIFGFHQAMDHIGAILGPLLATVFLLGFPGRYRTLFFLTAIPGAATVLLLRWLPESTRLPHEHAEPTGGRGAIGFEPQALPPALYRYLAVLIVFTLGNSTDAFLLLKLTEAAGGPAYIPLLWGLLHVVKAGVSLVGGAGSDRLGRRTLIAGGWSVYALAYAGFALSTSFTSLIAWFMVYGIYFGFVEGTERALIADFAPATHRGIVFGIYNAVSGLGALIASLVFGLIWTLFGSPAAFGLGAALAALAAVLLFIVVPAPRSNHL